MPNPLLICPVQTTTPVETGLTRPLTRAIPYDLLKEAANRLGTMSLLAAVLWLIGTALDHVALLAMRPEGDLLWKARQTTDMIGVVCVLASVALFFYTRKDGRDPRFLLDLGLAYMVLNSLAIGLIMHWEPVPSHWPIQPQITWVGAIILMCAAIVPNSPGKTLVAGLMAASMNPIGMLIARARDMWEFGPAYKVLVMHYPDYLLVGVAVVISHLITKLGQQVTKAREMGSYELIALLGKGGMGEVWRARHHMLARDAAIKLIQPEMLSRGSGSNAVQMRRRFEREARSTASLRSPHTVALYDFGVTGDGIFYYVMELLDGIDLDTLVRRFGPQSPARVVHILRQVCRSLGDAHGQGMIHRDIKPTNIFLCRLGNEMDFVKVLDFGLVKLVDGSETQMTNDGVTTGTPAYMAPEQALGNPDIDGRTDLYGLGCVAYWLLTGGLVFEEKGGTAMLLAHLQKVPVPPSARSELAVPAALDRAILMCLAKDPAERPASAEILARVLEECDGVGRWTSEDAERWWKINMPGPSIHMNEGAAQAVTQPHGLTTQ